MIKVIVIKQINIDFFNKTNKQQKILRKKDSTYKRGNKRPYSKDSKRIYQNKTSKLL